MYRRVRAVIRVGEGGGGGGGEETQGVGIKEFCKAYH